jgi:hypothetical protein
LLAQTRVLDTIIGAGISLLGVFIIRWFSYLKRYVKLPAGYRTRFPGIDPIVIHAIDKNKVFDVDAIITTGITGAESVGGKSPR